MTSEQVREAALDAAYKLLTQAAAATPDAAVTLTQAAAMAVGACVALEDK